MTQDATHRHQAATSRIEQAEKRDQVELESLKEKMKKMDSGRGAAQEMSNAVAGWVNRSERKLDDSIMSRKYYSQSRRSANFGR